MNAALVIDENFVDPRRTAKDAGGLGQGQDGHGCAGEDFFYAAQQRQGEQAVAEKR